MKFSTRIVLLISYLFMIFGLAGCATVTESGKKFLGVSTKALEEGRKEAIKQTFAYNLSACYDKLKQELVKRDCYIYARDPGRMIAIYVSETDTTPAGIFFKKVDDNNTQVEVSSPSSWAKEFIARRVASILQGTSDPDILKEREMQTNAALEDGHDNEKENEAGKTEDTAGNR